MKQLVYIKKSTDLVICLSSINYLKKRLSTLMLMKDGSWKAITIGLKKKSQSLPYKVCQDVSEDIIKPKKGLDYFGRSVAEEIFEDKNYALADGGFVEELEPIIEKVGAENIVIVQLTREGCDYSSDSRKYFNGRLINEWTVGSKTAIDKAYVLKEEMDIKTYRVHNNGSLHNLHDALEQIHNEINGEVK
jgi:hypothetical protein